MLFSPFSLLLGSPQLPQVGLELRPLSVLSVCIALNCPPAPLSGVIAAPEMLPAWEEDCAFPGDLTLLWLRKQLFFG